MAYGILIVCLTHDRYWENFQKKRKRVLYNTEESITVFQHLEQETN